MSGTFINLLGFFLFWREADYAAAAESLILGKYKTRPVISYKERGTELEQNWVTQHNKRA